MISAETILKPNMEYYIDKGLKQFEQPFATKYLLSPCTNPTHQNNLIVFGVYMPKTFTLLKNRTHNTYLIWGGSDFCPKHKKTIQLAKELGQSPHIQHLSISRCLYNRLLSFGIVSTLIDFNLVDTTLFKPIPMSKPSNIIYIYSGHPKQKGLQVRRYGKHIYDKIKQELSQFQYLLSHEVNAPYHTMPNIYATCFIVLRLTEFDGNANTVQECQAMQIPVVHNGSDYGLKWKTKEDVIQHILNSSS